MADIQFNEPQKVSLTFTTIASNDVKMFDSMYFLRFERKLILNIILNQLEQFNY